MGCIKRVFYNSDVLNNITLSFISDNEYQYIFTDEECITDDYEIIDDYHLLYIEDGIYQLIFMNKNMVYAEIIDIHNPKITTTRMIDGKYECIKTDMRIIKKQDLLTNEEKAADFWIRFFDKHDETAIDDYLNEPYIQHNPTVEDGVEAFRNEFHERFKSDMKYCSTKIMHISSRGDLVFIHNILKRSPEVKGHAGVDIFRFENGKIVEHWDVIQKMPSESKNDHPMF